MITNSWKRRVPRRKDRFFQTYVINLVTIFVVLPLIVLPFPFMKEIFLGDSEWPSIILMLVVLIGMNVLEWKVWQNVWRNFATDIDLEYEMYKSEQSYLFRWPRIKGTYRGNFLQIERFAVGHGKSRKIYTAISYILKAEADKRLEIISTNWFLSIKQAFFKKERTLKTISLNDKLFEKKFEIKGNDQQFSTRILSSQTIKQGLSEIRRQATEMKIEINGQEVHYQERSNIIDGAYLLGILNLMKEIANNVEREKIY